MSLLLIRNKLASGAQGGGGEFSNAFFSMNLTAAAGPNYGFTTLQSGHEDAYSHAFQNGGGVNGRNAVDVVFTPLANGTLLPANDCRVGWNGVSSWPSFSQGESLFIGVYTQYITTGTVLNSTDGGAWAAKEFIISHINSDTWRMICITEEPHVSPNFPRQYQKNIDGYPYSTYTGTYSNKLICPQGQANAIQMEVRTGPTAGGGGRFQIWVNNDNFSSPTTVSGTDLALDAAEMFGQPNYLGSVNKVQTGGTLTIRTSGLWFSKTFLEGFAAGM